MRGRALSSTSSTEEKVVLGEGRAGDVAGGVAQHKVRRLTRDGLAGLGTQRLAELLLQEARRNGSLLKRLQKALEARGDADPRLGEPEEAGWDESHMVGTSPPMGAVFHAIRKFAVTDAPVLITGESGTGKELVARAIHERSKYSAGPLVPINCAGLPPTLIASELFGHEKGSFTGAYQRKIGRIEAAKGGTVFLDEIGDLPLELQVHLLRFLQEKTIDRVGGNRPIHVDARVVAASNGDLRKAVAEGRFRDDLFYRLHVLCLDLPPLRERGEDIELLSMYFLRKFSQEMDRPVRGFDESALRALRSYRWPGNVRELISCIRRARVMAVGHDITVADLELPDTRPEGRTEPPLGEGWLGEAKRTGDQAAQGDIPPLARAKNDLEDTLIRETLRRNGRNITRTAERLGISRVTLYRLMEKHGIRPE